MVLASQVQILFYLGMVKLSGDYHGMIWPIQHSYTRQNWGLF